MQVLAHRPVLSSFLFGNIVAVRKKSLLIPRKQHLFLEENTPRSSDFVSKPKKASKRKTRFTKWLASELIPFDHQTQMQEAFHQLKKNTPETKKKKSITLYYSHYMSNGSFWAIKNSKLFLWRRDALSTNERQDQTSLFTDAT